MSGAAIEDKKEFFLLFVISNKPPCFNIIAPTLCADLFDYGIVCCRMQDVIFSEIERYMPDSFRARFVVSLRICKKYQVAARKVCL